MSDIKVLNSYIRICDLPDRLTELFPTDFDESSAKFKAQEGYIIDFKESIPEDFSAGYGAGIVRLAISFYNTFGGLIVFGVKDYEKTTVGCDEPFNVEGLTSYIRELTGHEIRIQHRTYKIEKDSNTLGIIG